MVPYLWMEELKYLGKNLKSLKPSVQRQNYTHIIGLGGISIGSNAVCLYCSNRKRIWYCPVCSTTSAVAPVMVALLDFFNPLRKCHKVWRNWTGGIYGGRESGFDNWGSGHAVRGVRLTTFTRYSNWKHKLHQTLSLVSDGLNIVYVGPRNFGAKASRPC